MRPINSNYLEQDLIAPNQQFLILYLNNRYEILTDSIADLVRSSTQLKESTSVMVLSLSSMFETGTAVQASRCTRKRRMIDRKTMCARSKSY